MYGSLQTRARGTNYEDFGLMWWKWITTANTATETSTDIGRHTSVDLWQFSLTCTENKNQQNTTLKNNRWNRSLEEGSIDDTVCLSMNTKRFYPTASPRDAWGQRYGGEPLEGHGNQHLREYFARALKTGLALGFGRIDKSLNMNLMNTTQSLSHSAVWDSTACFHLLECGVDPEKIELWHHLIDGASVRTFQLAQTEEYCGNLQKRTRCLCTSLERGWLVEMSTNTQERVLAKPDGTELFWEQGSKNTRKKSREYPSRLIRW